MANNISSKRARQLARMKLKKTPFTTEDGKRLAKLRMKKNPPSKEFLLWLSKKGVEARLKKLNDKQQ